MMQMTPTVKQLLIINVLFFIGTLIVGQPAYEYLGLFYIESSRFQVWQLLSHMFMHGNVLHIAFNMFALYSFGSMLEHFWGAKKFLFFYISCGLGAALFNMGINYYLFHDGLSSLVAQGFSQEEIIAVLNGKNNQELIGILNANYQSMTGAYLGSMVGASGAIYGLLVAFAFMAPNAELALMFIPIPIKAKYFVPGLLCLDLFLGVKGNSIFGGGTGVAHFAHIGGALVGFLMMWYWKKNDMNRHRWN
ncbi:MAG TPA: rhomboid family intramembrane serine protease [Flavobacterium sp.]|jgi:membrane associated rhomboid family serine protease|nr:rhomboid family intramembrane serine protease [Flavobacterium sp.]